MSKSPITIDDEDVWSSDSADWLPNPHAGDMLWLEFMEPIGLTAEVLAAEIEIDATRVRHVIDGQTRVDGELDLRLARYFRMSEGFFLRIQNSYELIEAKRALNGALDRIVPRAA